jgi:hypothetical protein
MLKWALLHREPEPIIAVRKILFHGKIAVIILLVYFNNKRIQFAIRSLEIEPRRHFTNCQCNGFRMICFL